MSEPEDGEDPEFDYDFDREWELLHAPRKWAPLARRVGGVNVIDPTRVHFFKLPMHRKVVLLALLLTLKDRATELRLEPWRDDEEAGSEGTAPKIRMFYEVDGRFYELVPPDADTGQRIVQEIESIAGLGAPSGRASGLLRRLADWFGRPDSPANPGHFRWRHGDFEADIEVMLYPSDWGDRLFLRFPYVPPVASKTAGDELKRIMESWRKARDEPRNGPS